MPPLPPSASETWQMFAWVIAAFLAATPILLTVTKQVNARRDRLRDAHENDRQDREQGNVAESARLRAELREAKELAERRLQECEHEGERWRAAYYDLRNRSYAVLNLARNLLRLALVAPESEAVMEEVRTGYDDLKLYEFPSAPEDHSG